MDEYDRPQRYRLILTDRELAQASLVNTLAFCETEFLPERLIELRRQLSSTSLPENILTEWRKWYLPLQYAETVCAHCESPLVLEYPDLLSGKLICPLCDQASVIEYRNLKPGSWFAKLPHLMDWFYPESDDPELACVQISGSATTEELLTLLDHPDIVIDPATTNRIKCRLALRGVPRERLEGLRAAAGEKVAELPPLNNLGLQAATEPLATEEPIQLEPLPEPDLASLTDQDLLELLALRASDYSKTAIGKMEMELVRRRFSLADISAWREGRPLSRPLVDEQSAPTQKPDPPGGILITLLACLSFTLILVWVLVAPNDLNWVAPAKQWLRDLMNIREQDLIIALKSIRLIGLLYLLATLGMLGWLNNVYKYDEELHSTPRKYRTAVVWIVILLPLISYYVYYQIGRAVLRASSTRQDKLVTPDLSATSSSGQSLHELLLLIANPALLSALLGFHIYAYFELLSGGTGEDLSGWSIYLPLQAIVLLGCIQFVCLINRRQREYRSDIDLRLR